MFPPLESRSVCHPLTVGPLLTRPSEPRGGSVAPWMILLSDSSIPWGDAGWRQTMALIRLVADLETWGRYSCGGLYCEIGSWAQHRWRILQSVCDEGHCFIQQLRSGDIYWGPAARFPERCFIRWLSGWWLAGGLVSTSSYSGHPSSPNLTVFTVKYRRGNQPFTAKPKLSLLNPLAKTIVFIYHK